MGYAFGIKQHTSFSLRNQPFTVPLPSIGRVCLEKSVRVSSTPNLAVLKNPKFSPGKHNELQAKIIRDFRSRFCPNTKLVYVGDTAKKLLYVQNDLLLALKIPITKHDKLPDVVLYDLVKDYLYLIEAVTIHGPLSPKRQIELEETLKDCKTRRIYVSAFPDFREFKKHIDNIAWETEIWIADNPDHMIHFNGPKFFTVY